MERWPTTRVAIAAVCAAFHLGCSGAPKETSGSGGSTGGGGATGQGGAGGTIEPGEVCKELSLPRRPFEDAEPLPELRAIASNVTIPTTAGDYDFAARWSGCESYLFIQDVPQQNANWPIGIWERQVEETLAAMPPNVQLFFVSVKTDESARKAALDALGAKVTEALAKLPAEDAGRWRARIHYVTAAATELGAWIGPLMKDPGWGLAVDRFQHVRYLGSYADYKLFDSDKSWFAPGLTMVANEAVHYNFEAERQAQLDEKGGATFPLFVEKVVGDPGNDGKRSYADVVLPDAATMADYDTLELDLSIRCGGKGEFGVCPPLAQPMDLRLCDTAEEASCLTQLGRWTTPSQREGRWVHDVSSFLPLLSSGGERRFAFYSRQAYQVTLSLRLSNGHKAARPAQTIGLWSADVPFDAAYDSAFLPVTVDIPADAEKVELVTMITGHGTSDPGNCAEFCDTTHTFHVNGTANARSFAQIENLQECMDQVAQGTVPNQYGTWWYGRAGWCPGREVPWERIDVTDQVFLGGQNEITYDGLYQGQPYPGGGSQFHVTATLLVSK